MPAFLKKGIFVTSQQKKIRYAMKTATDKGKGLQQSKGLIKGFFELTIK